MKARITIVFATAIVALAVAGGALAAPHQAAVKGWDYTRPGTVKVWNTKPWQIKAWAVKPNPSCIRLVKPNPSGIRGAANAVKGW
jgi:hypothetical protein